MGVHNLWKILDPVKEPIKLETLRGQTLAVDLSVWICDAQGVKQMQGVVAKPHLRNLFFRVSHLLQLGVDLIFVVDGEAPELKWEAMMMRQQARFGHAGVRTGGKPAKKPGRSHFRRLINECCQMLDYLGVPYIQSVGEAEAFCALLNKLGIADSVITQDGDAFLYGATKVYKNFSISGKDAQIESYSMEHVNAKLHLNRDKLIALGLLLGCDYVPKGVPGVGKETAMKFMMTYRETTSVLERFREWRTHPSSKVDSTIEGKLKGKALVVKEFPFEKVIEEFMVVKDKCPKRTLTWTKPQINKLYEFNEKMEWPSAYTNEKIIPLLTLHDMRMRRKNLSHPSEPKPERIVKARVRQFVPCFEVQWEKLECDTDPENTAEFYTTFEEKEMFTECYPELVSAFEAGTNKKNVKGEKKKRTSKKKAASVNLDSELCNGMDDVVDSLKLSDLTLEDSAKVVREPEILAAKTCNIPSYMNIPYSYESSTGTTRTSRENLVTQSRDVSVSSSICTLKGMQKKLQNASRESHFDLLAIPGRSSLVPRESEADDHDEPADLLTRLRRLRLQSSELPPAESRNETKAKGASDDNVFKSYDNECCMQQSLQGSEVPFVCVRQNQTPSGITFQSFNDSSLIRESEKLQEDCPASSTGVSYSCGTDVSYSCGTDISYSCVTSPCPVDVERILDGADQTGTSFRSLNDSVLLKESNRLYLERPDRLDQCFGDSSMLSESQVYGYTRGARAKGGCGLDEDEKLGKCRKESDDLYIYQPEFYQTIDQCFGDLSIISQSQVYGNAKGAGLVADCSLDQAEKPFENVGSACPRETLFDGDVGSGHGVEALGDKDTQLYDEPGSEALEDKDTQLYDGPSSEALEDKDTQLYDGPGSVALEDKDTQLYDEPGSEALEDKDTQLYDEPSSEALEDKDTQLYDEPCSEALEDKDTQLYDEPSSVALEDKDTQLYDEPGSESLEDKDTQLYDEGKSAFGVGSVIKQEPLTPKSVYKRDSAHHEHSRNQCGKFAQSVPVTLPDHSGRVAIKKETISPKRVSDACEVGTSQSYSGGIVIKQEATSPSHCSRSSTSLELTSGTDLESCVIKKEVISPKCRSRVRSVELKSQADSGSVTVKQEITSPIHFSRISTSLVPTSLSNSGGFIPKQEEVKPSHCSNSLECAVRIKSEKDEVSGTFKVTPVHDYSKVTLVPDYTKVTLVHDYTKETPVPVYTKGTPVHDYTDHNIKVKEEINSLQNHVEPSKNMDLIGKVNRVKAETPNLCAEMETSCLLSNSIHTKHAKSETVPVDLELVEFQPKFGETVTRLSSDGVRHVKMGQFEAEPQEKLSVSDIFSSDSMSKCSFEKFLEKASDRLKGDSVGRHHSCGHVAVLRGQHLEPALLFDDTVVSCAPGCEDATGCDEDVGVEMCGAETDENVASGGATHDPYPDVGVRTRRGRPKKAKIGKKKKPKKKKMKVRDDHDMNSILRQLETTTSCPSSPAILSLQSENDLLELLKAVATPESVNVPRRLPSVIPTDSQLDDLLNQIEVPSSPVIPDNQHDLSLVASVQERLDSPCRGLETVGAESQENSPTPGLPSGRVLADMSRVGRTPTLSRTSGDGSLLSEELKDLLKDIQTPVLNGRDKENLPHRPGTIVQTPSGDVDASLLMNLVSAWPSGKKQQPKKGRRKTRRKKMVLLAPLALNEVEDAGTLL